MNSLFGVKVDSVVDVIWVFEVIVAALVVFFVSLYLIQELNPKGEQYTLTLFAVPAGVFVSLDLSPLDRFVTKWSLLFEFLPQQFPDWVSLFLTIDTGLGLIFGGLMLIESGGILGLLSFILAFIGGLLLPYSPILAILFIPFSFLLMAISPANKI
jgi:hypothetical protein